MKITLCGSMATQQMLENMMNAAKVVEEQGHQPLVCEMTPSMYDGLTDEQIRDRKSRFMNLHISKIEESEAILVLNHEKNGISGYIGSNTFLEMGIATYLKKKVYLLHAPNSQQSCYTEVLGMKPIFLNGNLENLK